MYKCPSLIFILALLLPAIAHSQPRCDTASATLQSAKGEVVWRLSHNAPWEKAEIGHDFCNGDTIKVKSQRAALRLANDTLVRLKAKTTITLLPEKQSFWVELKQGAAHFLTRTPKKFTVKAPYLNAAVDGTEFVVTATPSNNQVAVFEGQVTTSNAFGEIILTDGLQTFCTPGSAPQVATKIRLRDTAEWALYYPPLIINTATPPTIQTLIDEQKYQQAIDALTQLSEANKKQKKTEQDLDNKYPSLQAALALSIGKTKQAKSFISQALQGSHENQQIDARALQALMSLIDGEPKQALTQTNTLLQSYPNHLSVLLAHSYALQGNGQLKLALKTVQQAHTYLLSQSPLDLRKPPIGTLATKASSNYNNATVVARLAELSLSHGDTHQAKKLITKALKQHPRNSRLHTLAGFVELNHLAAKQALTLFEQAIRLNNSDSLAYLGRALALIQQGQLQQGRESMELAVLLDPSSSLLRSYLGKTYFEDKHSDWSATQYQLAKHLDPNDPTPWFYESHLKLKQNKPVEALRLISIAIEKNDNRAVYRSRMLLDSDAAARSANQAGIYQALGFDELAQHTAAMAVSENPTDFAAHQALTQAYANDPKAYRVRADEALMTKLLQPIGAKALNIGTGTIGVQAMPWLAPSKIGLNEYSSLFTQRGISGHVTTFGGTQDTKGYQWQTQAIGKDTSLDFGQYLYRTEGFVENNHLNETISEVSLHHQLTDRFKFFVQHTDRKQQSGDLTHGIYSEQFDESFKNESEWTVNEIGGRYEIGENTWLVGHIGESKDRFHINYTRKPDPSLIRSYIDRKEKNRQLSLIHSSKYLRIRTGFLRLSYIRLRTLYVDDFFRPTTDSASQNEAYLNIVTSEVYSCSLSLTAALDKQAQKVEQQQLKIGNIEYGTGLTWRPSNTTTLLFTRNRRQSKINSPFGRQTPTHTYGTQIETLIGYAAPNTGTSAQYFWNTEKLNATFSIHNKKYRHSTIAGTNFDSLRSYPISINLARTSFYFYPNQKWGVATTFEASKMNTKEPSHSKLSELKGTTTSFNLSYFPNRIVDYKISLKYVQQKERYLTQSQHSNPKAILDLAITLDLPNSVGKIQVSGHNLLGQTRSKYQNRIQISQNTTDPIAPDSSYDRELSFILTLNY